MKKSSDWFALLLLVTVIVSSCNDKEQPIPGFIMNTIFFVTYTDVNGVNLVQHDSQIEVYYERNGVAEKVQRSNLTYPNGFTISSQRNTAANGSDELCVKVFPSDFMNNENISTTYIRFGNVQMDTIKCQFQTTSNSLILSKTWLNGSLVWDKQTASSFPLIQIIK